MTLPILMIEGRLCTPQEAQRKRRCGDVGTGLTIRGFASLDIIVCLFAQAGFGHEICYIGSDFIVDSGFFLVPAEAEYIESLVLSIC